MQPILGTLRNCYSNAHVLSLITQTCGQSILLDFDPLSLPADKVRVELEVGPSVLFLYGALLKLIINLKVQFSHPPDSKAIYIVCLST